VDGSEDTTRVSGKESVLGTGILHTDLHIPTVKTEITDFSTKYREKLITHPNELIPAVLEEEGPRRLKRFKPTDLAIRFS